MPDHFIRLAKSNDPDDCIGRDKVARDKNQEPVTYLDGRGMLRCGVCHQEAADVHTDCKAIAGS